MISDGYLVKCATRAKLVLRRSPASQAFTQSFDPRKAQALWSFSGAMTSFALLSWHRLDILNSACSQRTHPAVCDFVRPEYSTPTCNHVISGNVSFTLVHSTRQRSMQGSAFIWDMNAAVTKLFYQDMVRQSTPVLWPHVALGQVYSES